MKSKPYKIATILLLLICATVFISACSVQDSKAHTVTFADSDGTVYKSVLVADGERAPRPDTPSKPGGVFAGWYYGDTQWSFSTPIKEDVTIVAQWIKFSFTVTFNSDGAESFAPITVQYGDTLTLPTPTAREDYTFFGWYNGGVKWDESKPVTANTNLTAVWRPNSVAVKFDYKNGTASSTVVIGYGKALTEPESPTKDNAIFLGWFFGNEKWDFNNSVTDDITLTAKWQSEYLLVTFDTKGGTPTESVSVRYNTEIPIPEDPKRDTYTFAGWYNGTTPFDFTKKITSDITLTARWEEVRVTVTYDTAGGTTVPSASVHIGTVTSAPLSPTKTSYFFDCWYLNGVPFDFSTPITENITLTAKWITAQEMQWQNYESSLPKSTYNALKSLFDYYDGYSTTNWLAGLWDGNLGGFYYSNSARDYSGYLIDLESTKQAIGWMTANGLISNVNQLPNSMKVAMVAFAKSTQSASDGYFYHPQWPTGTDNLATDRYGRDLSWATGLINDLDIDTNGDGVLEDQYPNYCTPNGYKCKQHKFGGGSCSFPRTSASTVVSSNASYGITSLLHESSVSSAVLSVTGSVVIPTASVSSKPDYSSAAAFSAWLEAYNSSIKKDSGKAHNLNALKDEIIAHGYGEIVLDHLDRVQKEVYNEQVAAKQTPTGLWQKDINYKAVWGLLKYAAFYNDSDCRREIKYALEIVDTAIKVINLPPDGAYYMNDLYNQWSSINSLLNNVKYFAPDKMEQIYEKFRAGAPTLIENTLKKIEPFKTAGGGFGYTSTGNSLTTIYGVPISKGFVESDVNGTTLCCSLYRSVFTCLGYTVVPLCSSEDYSRFLKIVTATKPKESFSDGIPDNVTERKKTTEYKLETITDPKDSANKVLSFTSGIIKDDVSDRITFATKVSSGKCFVFESDIYLDSSSDNGYLFQINIGSAYMVTLHKNGNTVTVMETDTTAQNPKTTLGTVRADEWFTLRVEYYTHTSLGTTTPKIKVFINDKIVAESELYYGKCDNKTPPTQYTQAYFYSMKAVKTKILIDNCYFTAIDKDYSSTSHSTKDITK